MSRREGHATPGEPKPRLPHLNEEVFAGLERWRLDYNLVRPHSAIGYLTPCTYAAALNPQRAPALRHPESSAPMPVATVALTRNSLL